MRTKRNDDGLYDLAPEDPPQRPPPRDSASPPPAAGRAGPVLDYRSGDPSNTAPLEPETIRNLHMPLWLLGVGVVVQTAAAFLSRRDLTAALTEVGVELLAGTALMCTGLLLAARLRGIDLGSLRYALLKLAALSVAPAAALTLAGPALRFIPFGGILGWIGSFVLYFALLGVLFDLDESDTWYCICIIFLVRLAVYFAWLAIGV